MLMKKIYASMIALCCGALVSTAAKPVVQVANFTDNARTVNNLSLKAGQMDSHKMLKAPTIDTNDDAWTTIGQNYFTDRVFTGEDYIVTIQESKETPGLYRIPDAWTPFEEAANPLYIDATDPNCVFVPEQSTGIYDDEAESMVTILSFSQYVLIQEGGEVTNEDIIEAFSDYVITLADGIINFPAHSLLVYYPETTDPDIQDNLYYANSSTMMLYMPGTKYVAEWGEKVKSEMYDTFFEPLFVGYEAAPVEVEVQKNNLKEGYYRVIDPWALLLGEEGGGYPFYIDASNPDCVVIPLQNSGIYTGSVDDGGRGMAYFMSLSYNYDTTEEFLASEDADFNIYMDKEKVIHFDPITVELSSGPADVSTIFIYWPDFNESSLYYNTSTGAGYVKIPEFAGIYSVSEDNIDLTPEYYTIQGVKVQNPVVGNFYIVKKGNKAYKRIYR